QANGHLGVARFNPDGTPDPTFGTGGEVVVPFESLAALSPHVDVTAAALAPDGKIVAAGMVNVGTSVGEPSYWFARLNPDGSLDPTFGANGIKIVHGPFSDPP